jgi:hypothetical protein
MKALIKGGLLGGLAMFIWGTISWTVLPWRRTSFRTFTDENAVAQILMANAPRRGVYVLPNPFRAGSLPVDGPQAFVTFDERRPDSRGRPLGGGLLIHLLGAVCLTWLLVQAKLGYWGRVASATAAGLFAGVVSDLPNWNWWNFPTGYTVVSVLDHTLAGFLAGLVIAWTLHAPAHTILPE